MSDNIKSEFALLLDNIKECLQKDGVIEIDQFSKYYDLMQRAYMAGVKDALKK